MFFSFLQLNSLQKFPGWKGDLRSFEASDIRYYNSLTDTDFIHSFVCGYDNTRNKTLKSRGRKNSEANQSTLRNIGKSKDHVFDGNIFLVNL